MAVVCPMCVFESPNRRLLLSHLRLVHASNPHFSATCGIDGCSYTAKTFSAYYSHIYRRHKEFIRPRSKLMIDTVIEPPLNELRNENVDDIVIYSSTTPISDNLQSGLDCLLGLDADIQKRSSALFILKLKEFRRVSQNTIDDVLQEWMSLFENTAQRLEASVEAILVNSGVDKQSVEGLHDIFMNAPNPFNGLETCYKQEKYFRDYLGLVEPQEVKLGESYYEPHFSGSKRRLVEVNDSFQYIPLLESVRNLLYNPKVMDEIDSFPNRICTDNVMNDFCDGKLYRSHPIFSRDKKSLQIIAFYDELEVCNPLGSHVKKHKLGIILFSLGNIAPKYRSALHVFQLVAVATVPIIQKYGIDEILRPFIRDLKVLSLMGITIKVNGIEKVFRGALLAFLADNLGSHVLGGFKESFSFAMRICRSCNATKTSCKDKFDSSSFQARSDEQHKAQCELLNGATFDHYSKTYGINRCSSLLEIPYFSLFNGGLPHDAMHDIFEGVALSEISAMLQHFINHKHYFSIEQFNHRLSCFDFQYTETSKPTPISKRHLMEDKKLKQSASQTLLLLRILPLLIGKFITENDEHWQCFLLLLRIVDIVLCPSITEGMCFLLKLFVKEHHSKFVSLYSKEIVTPKFHYLIHYPEQMMQLGPMIRSWNMRNEAKLNIFKRASHIGNFKNIAFSLASRHQRLLCYQMTTNFLSSDAECGPSQQLNAFALEPPDVQLSLCQLLNAAIDSATPIDRPAWVKKEGMLFKKNKNCYLVLNTQQLNPTFGLVTDILNIRGYIVFLVTHCKTEYYDDHYHSFVIRHTADQTFVLFNNISYHSILHSHIVENIMFVYLKWYLS